jgi:hypothetical protein
VDDSLRYTGDICYFTTTKTYQGDVLEQDINKVVQEQSATHT